MDGAVRTCCGGHEMQFDVLNSPKSPVEAKAMVESLIAGAGDMDVCRIGA